MVSFVTSTQPRLTAKRVSMRGTLSWPMGTFVRECVNTYFTYIEDTAHYGQHHPLGGALNYVRLKKPS